MQRGLHCVLALCLLAANPQLFAQGLKLTSPVDYQVVQRSAREEGVLRLAGEVSQVEAPPMLEARITRGDQVQPWQKLAVEWTGPRFAATLKAPAGGWFQLQVRAMSPEQPLEAAVEHVGIGEVFVVAGQSNSANHGEEKQQTQTRRVAAFDGQRWRLADDPQPGASGGGGSFMPPLGDALVRAFDVPIGFVACGVGATSVREWLPAGATFPHPPTLEGNVRRLASGEWASKGQIYTRFLDRMKPLGPQGFRAVLWHQGESDANQKDASRTLPGKLYREYLERVIRDSRRDLGWEAPWFVAQVSYHVPDDASSPEIRDAQAALWRAGLAQAGPDSDALVGTLRERNGQGVHFSGPGLREHAARWGEKVAPWLEQELRGATPQRP